MPNDNNGAPNSGSDGDKGTNTGYSAEYVKSLRDEAASWRTKFRETESKIQELENTIKTEKTVGTIKSELDKRGIKCDPSWIKMEDGVAPDKAVDKFLKDYPQFAQSNQEQFMPRSTPRPMGAQRQDSNIENTAKSELDAIKKDPVARAKLREMYRGLLANSAGTSYVV